MSMERRVGQLERRVRSPGYSGRSEAMKRLLEHLSRLAALRRGELSEEEGAEVRAANAAIRRRMAELRGEGAS